LEILDRINQLLSLDEPFCLATVLESHSSHVISGTKVIVRVDGSHESTSGMDDIDVLIAQTALRCSNGRKKLTAQVA
jgi:hypothetical protein